jgi:hypothetical protein
VSLLKSFFLLDKLSGRSSFGFVLLQFIGLECFFSLASSLLLGFERLFRKDKFFLNLRKFLLSFSQLIHKSSLGLISLCVQLLEVLFGFKSSCHVLISLLFDLSEGFSLTGSTLLSELLNLGFVVGDGLGKRSDLLVRDFQLRFQLLCLGLVLCISLLLKFRL